MIERQYMNKHEKKELVNSVQEILLMLDDIENSLKDPNGHDDVKEYGMFLLLKLKNNMTDRMEQHKKIEQKIKYLIEKYSHF